MDDRIQFIKDRFKNFNVIDFYKHFGFTEAGTGERAFAQAMDLICTFAHDIPVKVWAIENKKQSGSYKHFKTIDTMNHWLEVAVKKTNIKQQESYEQSRKLTYERVIETVSGKSSRSPKRRRNNASNDGITGSQDAEPRRKTRTHTEVQDDDGWKDEKVEEADKWHIRNKQYCVSNYLFKYRQRCIEHDKALYKEPSLSRILALQHIFYFSIDREKSCVQDLDDETIAEIYNQLPLPDDPKVLTAPVDEYIEKSIKMLKKQMISEVEKLRTFGSIMVAAAETENTMCMKTAEILFDVGRAINTKKGRQDSGGEDTFAHQVITSVINSIFKGERFAAKWANVQLAACAPPSRSSTSATKLLPDFILIVESHGKQYDVIAIEIKPPRSQFADDDVPKIAVELHRMLDSLVDLGCEEPVVCGVSIDGYTCATITMDLKYNGIFRYTEHDEFTLPSTVEDLAKIKYIVAAFQKMQNVACQTRDNITKKLKSCKNENIMCNTGLMPEERETKVIQNTSHGHRRKRRLSGEGIFLR